MRQTSLIVDCIMCWMALGGLANVTVGLAIAARKLPTGFHGLPANAPTSAILSEVGIYLAVSAVGFSYLLWRSYWRCRLSTVLNVTALFCVWLAAVTALPHPAGVLVAVAFALTVFIYAIYWICRTAPPAPLPWR